VRDARNAFASEKTGTRRLPKGELSWGPPGGGPPRLLCYFKTFPRAAGHTTPSSFRVARHFDEGRVPKGGLGGGRQVKLTSPHADELVIAEARSLFGGSYESRRTTIGIALLGRGLGMVLGDSSGAGQGA